MRTKVISTFALSTMLAAGAFAASNTPSTTQTKPAKAPVMQASANTSDKAAKKLPDMTGTIVSFNDSSLVLSHGKKKMETSFTLNAETKREGNLANGARATVWYRRSGTDRIATMIRVRGARTTAHHTAAQARPKSS